MQEMEPCEEDMQIEEPVFEKHQDTQKVPLGGTVPLLVTPSQHATAVQGQTCQQGEVCLGVCGCRRAFFKPSFKGQPSTR